ASCRDSPDASGTLAAARCAVNETNGHPGLLRTDWLGLVERVPAGAGSLGHRVVDGEPGGLQGVHEVDGGLGDVRRAHAVHHQPDPELFVADVLVPDLVVQVHRVAEARASAGLHGDPKGDVGAALL